jgi:hypothetical protein
VTLNLLHCLANKPNLLPHETIELPHRVKFLIIKGDTMAQGGETGEVDLYRDTWVRYLGIRISGSCDVLICVVRHQASAWYGLATRCSASSPLWALPAVPICANNLFYTAGYANELGESFKAFLPRSAYIGSYIVSSTYVMADAYDKGQKEHQVRSALAAWLRNIRAPQ